MVLLWTWSNTSMSFLNSGHQSWMQNSKCDLIRDVERRFTSFDLLAMQLWVQLRLSGLWVHTASSWSWSGVEIFISHHPQVLLHRAALNPFSTQPGDVSRIAMTLYISLREGGLCVFKREFDLLCNPYQQVGKPLQHLFIVKNTAPNSLWEKYRVQRKHVSNEHNLPSSATIKDYTLKFFI